MGRAYLIESLDLQEKWLKSTHMEADRITSPPSYPVGGYRHLPSIAGTKEKVRDQFPTATVDSRVTLC